ncbi:hypothetical protein HYDPIDRAFT_42253 [Hydnomerulius pinastri MD-312]|uniref:Zn(2)-C6 fungal-type domain-containing protein n=1 Tax=Hydnomerulius pinastri MD-312 TaxID=994086 RepID=A0A0C9W5J9_9AGAM|nr:hypothetical protein HYDPIDRAFT_42253 [Hydnomerulius pinastri MD-312]
MSSHYNDLSVDQHQYSSPAGQETGEEYYDTYSTIMLPTGNGPAMDFYMPENLYLWQDGDGVYHWADAPAARSDNFAGYSSPSYYSSSFSSGVNQPSDRIGSHQRINDIGPELSPPAPAQMHLHHAHTPHVSQQSRIVSSRSQAQDYRSSIARASDNFLAQASSLFSDGHSPSSSRRGNTLDYQSSVQYQSSPQRSTRPPSRKRSIEAVEGPNFQVKEEEDSAHSSSLSGANDTCCLPQPPMIVPSQGASFSLRISRTSETPLSLIKAESHSHEHDSLLLRHDERYTIPLPKHLAGSNKRVHHSSEELVRQESTIVSTTTTWPISDDSIMKGVKKGAEQKKQALACLFCRERKIACGRPAAHSQDQTCNQCARRRIKCEYPTESRRGQHKRRRKPLEGETTSQDTSRTNSTSSIASTSVMISSSTRVTSST